ncbi:hypothetical protein C0995_008557 [Termitomyces sp. Mi166|nr:hypothetical protein C0995_008557 [Termitomyces sp. Mi166\
MHKDASNGLALTTTRPLNGLDSRESSIFDPPTQGTPNILDNNAQSARHKPQTPRLEINLPTYEVSKLPTSFVVVSGGTGGNAICTAFSNASYVLPVSDDGGSSSEIIRVLGGPSIGDIRSRLIRLIPNATPGSPLDAIRRLLSYRLPARCSEREARDEWREIVEGRNALWMGIPADRKETIRGMRTIKESSQELRLSQWKVREHLASLRNLSVYHDAVVVSIGNYFLAAAQGFFRSLPSAIFLFSSITNSQDDGRRLVGQCEISHPVPSNPKPVTTKSSIEDAMSPVDGMGEFISQRQNMMFESTFKAEYEPLGSRIATLRGVASGITRSSSLRAKILLLNSTNDRETDGYSAVDYIQAIARTLNGTYQTQPYGLGNANTTYPISAFVTHLVYLKDGSVQVDTEHITRLGVKCVQITSVDGHTTSYNAELVEQAITEILAEV